jgi:predicted lipid-binding transport protein (Tim44 family)
LKTQAPTPQQNQNPNAVTGPCVTVNVCSLGALIGGLTAGIIAAIIVAAILGFALCSGGAVAAANAAGNRPGAGLLNNPLYTPSGDSAGNPLFGDGAP